MDMRLGRQRTRRGRPLIAAGLAIAVVAALLWLFRLGAAPDISLATDTPALGAATRVLARFAARGPGLTTVRLELEQGGRSVVLAEQQFPAAGMFGSGTRNAELAATAGYKPQPWLAAGEAVLRASAERATGPLRRRRQAVHERRVEVRREPPSLQVLSRQHYVRQGGSGVVVFRTGATTMRSGVRAGDAESVSYPRPGGPTGERFALYGIPWRLANPYQVVLFAEDDAGHRVERPFVDRFRARPPGRDTITVTDEFLARVVPAILAGTPDFEAPGSPLEQFLAINGRLREASLRRLIEVTFASAERVAWSGPFLQMPDTERRASFAEERTYRYQGRVVDRQTHLGLDLASVAGAPVPAANAGTVVFAGWLGIYGNTVVIDHGYGLASLYGHLSSLAVAQGTTVRSGQRLGTSGATGLAGGDHLHLEILLQGRSVDPIEWLDGKWIRDNLSSKLPALQ
jgi:murein DD-endopeptidase MepM/ murein hydrolase activator NlpD